MAITPFLHHCDLRSLSSWDVAAASGSAVARDAAGPVTREGRFLRLAGSELRLGRPVHTRSGAHTEWRSDAASSRSSKAGSRACGAGLRLSAGCAA
jgi:hypothetical protein